MGNADRGPHALASPRESEDGPRRASGATEETPDSLLSAQAADHLFPAVSERRADRARAPVRIADRMRPLPQRAPRPPRPPRRPRQRAAVARAPRVRQTDETRVGRP